MRRVLFCGNSLLISGLQASLVTVPGLDLQIVDTHPENIRERIQEWQPEVLILETRLFQCTLALVLLHDFPQLKLIGLDNEDNRLLVFSGQASLEPTSEKLLEVIEGRWGAAWWVGDQEIERLLIRKEGGSKFQGNDLTFLGDCI